MSYLTGTITLYSFRRFIPLYPQKSHFMFFYTFVVVNGTLAPVTLGRFTSARWDVCFAIDGKPVGSPWIYRADSVLCTLIHMNRRKKVPEQWDGAKEKCEMWGISGSVLGNNILLACLVDGFVGKLINESCYMQITSGIYYVYCCHEYFTSLSKTKSLDSRLLEHIRNCPFIVLLR